MNQKTFNQVAAIIFLTVALLHLLRAYMGWAVVIGDWIVPMWLSWVGFVIAGGLACFALSLSQRR